MERYKELKEMLHAELERIQNKGELNTTTLAQADLLAHTLKDILTIEEKEEQGGYSEHFPMYPYRGSYGYYEDGGSYGPGRGRGSNANRDSMGRYSSENRRGSYDDGESMDASYRRR